MNSLVELDHSLFAMINMAWTNEFFDWLFPRITDLHKEPVFIGLVLILIAYWIYREKKRAAIWVLTAIVSIGLSDLFSYRVIKANIIRERPQYAGVELSLRTHSHTGKSFPSNHAANVFAAATSLTGSLPVLGPVLFIIAALVSYSRIYVGVHFPADVMAGALIGTLIALLVRLLFRQWLIRSGADSSRARS